MKKLILLFGVMAFLVSNAMSQGAMQAKKFENVTWQRIVLVNFKPGKVSRAKEIMEKYIAAGMEAQVKGPQRFWLETGEYDMMLIWTLDGGPSDLEWERSPDGVKWRNALIKLQGSEEAANNLQEEYSSLVSNSTSFIGRKDM